jgi:hypothetical protein
VQDATCAEETRKLQLTATPRVLRFAWSAALLLAICVVFTIAAMGGHSFITDDVFFYLRIADSIVRGQGSSFNGVLPTNGFHPLWELVCVLERLLAGDRNHAFLRVHLAVSGALSALVALLLARFPRSTRMYLPLAALLTTLYVLRNATGSEQHLSLLLLVCLIWRYRQSVTTDWSWGVLLGLALLARLDSVFALTGLFVTYVLRDEAARVRRFIVTGAAAGLVIAPYFAWNLLEFGHLQPISGAVKSGLAASMPFRADKLGAFAALLCGLTVALVAWLVYSKDWRRRDSLLWFGAGACVHALYTYFLLEAVWTWYFSTELLFVAITLGDLFDRWSSRELAPRQLRSLTSAVAVLAVLALAFAGRKAWQHLHSDSRSPWYIDAGQWLSTHLPADAVIATACTPGAIGYFTRQPVIAFDGLTGDYAFQESLVDKGLVATLAGLGVTHLISFGPEGEMLDRYVGLTERIGHGGAGGAFYANEKHRASEVGLFSPFAKRIIGRYPLLDADLVGQSFCFLDLAVWRFVPR